ncbi:hypothetical protein EYR38_009341 [Pleurotus pulmonarius]|nr:hypothetical protein EYR38_009341 [Pleurotus pulmonarius]
MVVAFLDVLSSGMKSGFALAILAATLVAGRAHNDWSKPCFEGECAYDIPDHKQQSGAVKLDIRLVCKGDDAEGSGCAHLFGGAGPVDKHVRLPESCSSLPFARISKFWVHEDQSVPEHHGVTRRDNSVPQVYAVNIDDKFDQVDYSKHGDVHFVMYGASAPGVDINAAIPEDVSDMDAVGEFIQKAVSELQDGIKSQRNHYLQARTTTPGGWKFTKISATVSPFYPDGKPSIIPVTSPDISPQALPKGANQGAAIKLPTGTDIKSVVTPASKGWGSASTAFSSFEIKGHAMSCPVEALGSSKKGVETKVELDITGTIDTFMWGEGQWGGSGYGKNNVFSKLLGFLEDFTLNVRHENNINIALKGSTTWSKEFGPFSVPQVTALHIGVGQIGLLGAVKLEAKLSAEASLQLTNKLQYGFNHATITMPSKEKGGLKPYFNATEIGAKYAGGAKAKVSLEIGVTPKIMVGAMTTGGGAKADSWFGVEVKLSAEAEASKTIFESGSNSPPGPADLGYVVKIGIDPHVGVEAKIDWSWLKSWTGWTPGMELKHSLFKHEWPPLACGGSSCPSKKRSTNDNGEMTLRSIDYSAFDSGLSKRASPKVSVPAKSTSFTCPPKEWAGKAKEFVGGVVDMAKLYKGVGLGLVAVVTGGGTGIGLMISYGLAANGAKVYITGRRQEVLQKAANDWNQEAGAIIPLQMDATNKASILAARDKIEQEEGRLHILVNNAGQVGPTSPFLNDLSAPEHQSAETLGRALFDNESFEGWADLYAINTFSIFFVSTAFVGLLAKGTKEQEASGYTSSIINTTSISGVIKVAQNHFCYNSAKGAASHLTKLLSTEFALKGIPVRVNAIAPGVYASEMTFDTITPEQVDRIGMGVHPVPAKRAGTVQEMAGTAVYLASLAGCYTNGQEIVIDGGYVAVNPSIG